MPFNSRRGSSMHSLLELGKKAAGRERAIGSLRERTVATLAEARRLFAQEFSRLQLRATVRSYLSVLTTSNVSAILRRTGEAAKGRGPMTTGMHDPVAAVRWNRSERFFDYFERLWRERARGLYRRLARGYSREFMKLLNSAIDYFEPKFTNATRMLKEQLTAQGVSVWVSPGCLEEFAKLASLAAARRRQPEEPYISCLRPEVVTHARFIREWTSSDKNFDQTQWGELVSVARRYALPRPWKVFEAAASVHGHTIAAGIPTQKVLKCRIVGLTRRSAAALNVDGRRVERVQGRGVQVEAAIDLVARIQIDVGERRDPAQRRVARNACLRNGYSGSTQHVEDESQD
jgi:hypothetical protein